MQLRQVVDLLRCEVLSSEKTVDTVSVEACFDADLMSDALAYSRPGALLVTGLAALQAVQTADVADLAAVLFVVGKRPPRNVIDFADRRGIVLLSTQQTLHEACGVLNAAGLARTSKT
jgi:predicted transcriptional regulator